MLHQNVYEADSEQLQSDLGDWVLKAAAKFNTNNCIEMHMERKRVLPIDPVACIS